MIGIQRVQLRSLPAGKNWAVLATIFAGLNYLFVCTSPVAVGVVSLRFSKLGLLKIRRVILINGLKQWKLPLWYRMRIQKYTVLNRLCE